MSCNAVMAWPHAAADEADRAGLARYRVRIAPALGVPMSEIKRAGEGFRWLIPTRSRAGMEDPVRRFPKPGA